ncbi:CIC11C00000002059 [Sungouiella intermedia]|uniref:CIC11C00000002059 n=1 Tax=Sungouiella intermedia TaxID=45354 RepID=A0A1L0BNL8_9ASCO|nr:CIC11C00000002059 [[Candida] intermedia]
MSHPYARRLLKEYKAFLKASLPGISMLPESDMCNYRFEITTENPLYAGQTHLLHINIGDQYPVDSPLVYFTKTDHYVIPMHPHIYSNGHICLNLLGRDWTPACGVEAIVLSIQSVLSHNDEALRPVDNERYVAHAPIDPKKSTFVFHDDNV